MFITPKYSQSFRPSRICRCLFGDVLTESAINTTTVPTGTTVTTNTNSCNDDSGCGSSRGCTIAIQGSAVPTTTANNSVALAAENFLLARDFNGEISFKPQVRTFSLDFQFYMALDEWCEGLFFRVYGPFVHNRYDLRFNEDVISAGTAAGGYAAGFFDTVAVPQANLLQSFQAYAQGNTIAYPGSTVTVQPLQYAKLPCGALKQNSFANLRFDLGYNFWSDEDYHLGFMLEAAAPTGKRPDAEYLFSPNSGGKHWELGGGLTGHYTLWRSEDEEKHFDFVMEADVNHLFKSKETRTFDLKGKGLSRYLLAERLVSPAAGLTSGAAVGTAVAPALQFGSMYAPVANISTVRAKVSVDVEVDLVGMFNFTARGWSVDLGYNFWYRGCEKIDVDCFNTSNLYGIKGDASVFGFNGTTPVALSATNSGATIQGGTSTAANLLAGNNANVDSPALAFTDGATPTTLAVAAGVTPSVQINTSTAPVVITLDSLDIDGARSRGMSHKIFTHLNYTWTDREDWIPYVGFGADVEFGTRSHSSDSSCPTSTTTTTNTMTTCDSGSSCHQCALSQWAVWVKGGLSFN